MYKTFWIDVLESEFDYVENYVSTNPKVDEYLISHELKNSQGVSKPHFHVVLKIDDVKTANNILKHFYTKYNLKNEKKSQGGKRFYGMLKRPIDDPDRLKIYCCKEGNIRSNIPDAVLKELADKSFMKSTTLKKILEVETREYIETKFPFGFRREATDTSNGKKFTYYNTKELKIEIIEYIVKVKKLKITKHQLENYFLQIIQLSENPSIGMKSNEIYEYFYENQ